MRGDDGELRAAVEPAGLDPVQDLGRVDRRLCRDLDGQIVGPVGLDPADAGLSGQQALPGAGNVAAERGGGSEPGDDDADA